jgi:hypothetical protein
MQPVVNYTCSGVETSRRNTCHVLRNFVNKTGIPLKVVLLSHDCTQGR